MRQQKSQLRSQLGSVNCTQEPIDVEGIFGELVPTAYIGVLEAFVDLVHFHNHQCGRSGDFRDHERLASGFRELIILRV